MSVRRGSQYRSRCQVRSQPPIWSHMPLIATLDKQQHNYQKLPNTKKEVVPRWYPSGTQVVSKSYPSGAQVIPKWSPVISYRQHKLLKPATRLQGYGETKKKLSGVRKRGRMDHLYYPDHPGKPDHLDLIDNLNILSNLVPLTTWTTLTTRATLPPGPH